MSLGLSRAGMRPIWYAEIEPYAAYVFAKHHPGLPNLGGIRNINPTQWQRPDVLCGGFPCQDISLAGKGLGLCGARSGLWYEYNRLINHWRPDFAIIENVSALRYRGLDQVLRSLSEIGYDAEWHCIPAGAVGAPHRRDRVWVVAYQPVANANSPRLERRLREGLRQCAEQWAFRARGSRAPPNSAADQWFAEPGIRRVVDGCAFRVDRLRCLGNSVVPQVAEIVGRAIISAANGDNRMSLTAESVCAGHPDKIADQISDAILDGALRLNTHAKVGCEVLVTKSSIHISGEVSGAAPDYRSLAAGVISGVGQPGWSPALLIDINQQSGNIAAAVERGGAGDQGIVYGFATTETASRIPLALEMAHAIVQRLDVLRSELPIGPDGKAQVTVGFRENACISIQCKNSDANWVRQQLEFEIESIVGHRNISLDFFSVGGAMADTGLTGRKLQIDTYGGAAPNGGGAFSGKDPSKMDRTGAYLARYLALRILQEYGLEKVTVGLAYRFGVSDPVWVCVNTDRNCDDIEIREWVMNNFELTPAGAINKFSLLRPIYAPTATYGHFGRPEFPWEMI